MGSAEFPLKMTSFCFESAFPVLVSMSGCPLAGAPVEIEFALLE